MSKSALDNLQAISLLDGRNWDKVKEVSAYFSEFALIRYRIIVEIKYLVFLSRNTKIVRRFTAQEKRFLENIYLKFGEKDALWIKEKEKIINHDVKAVEYFLKKKMEGTSLKDVAEYIHFALTSYDVNIPAYALILKDFSNDIYIPKLLEILNKLKELIIGTKSMVMLGRTHGQPALPTTMGKEMAVFYQRILKELAVIRTLPIEGKLTGAVGNFNAHAFVAPEINWIQFSRKFIKSLGLAPNIITTQIMPYDSWLALFDSIKRLNNILLGLTQDIWWYISFEYFLQKKKNEEVGSSTMSHKINPITFENAEGNLGLANSLFEFFVRKLPVSRLQRDLTDSTIKRDFGLAFGFTLLAWDSLLNGLGRISPNPDKMKQDLDGHWEIFSEGIQTYLRVHGFHNAYEILKEKTRGRTMTKAEIYKVIDQLPIAAKDKKYLKIKDISAYSGYVQKLTETAIGKSKI